MTSEEQLDYLPSDEDVSSTPRGELSTLTSYQVSSANEDGEYPDIYRGNKESTWRKWNAEEIQLSKSLDKIRARDLSVHLYNAHKLSRVSIPQGCKPDDQLPSDQFSTWRPPKHWTAWPLPPDIVPREPGYEPGATKLDLPTPYVNIAVKPSQLLEENLLATTLKHANAQLKSSQSDVSITTDDDAAHNLLRPQIRHTFFRLDTLFTILHRTRASYAGARDRDTSASESKPETRPGSRGRQSKHIQRRSGTPAPPLLGRQASLSEAGDGDDRPSKRKRHLSSRLDRSRRRRLKLGLRGWEDVISAAAMAGLGGDVVRKAGERCEALFSDRGVGNVKSKGKEEDGSRGEAGKGRIEETIFKGSR